MPGNHQSGIVEDLLRLEDLEDITLVDRELRLKPVSKLLERVWRRDDVDLSFEVVSSKVSLYSAEVR